MRHSRKTTNYLKRITLFDLTHKIGMTDFVAFGVNKLMIDSECYLEKEFIELICVNS